MLLVPQLYQPPSPYCGAVCAQMVLAYYGKLIPLEDIVSALPLTKSGVYPPELAQFLRGKGFEVTLNLWLKDFPNKLAYVSEDEARGEMRRWAAGYRRTARFRGHQKSDRSLLDKFLRQGGVAVPKRTTIAELKTALSAGIPPILCVNSAVYRPWYGKAWREKRVEKKRAGHYVVLTDMTGSIVTVNDPSRANGGPLVLPIELLMYACYSWDAEVIFAKPRPQ